MNHWTRTLGGMLLLAGTLMLGCGQKATQSQGSAEAQSVAERIQNIDKEHKAREREMHVRLSRATDQQGVEPILAEWAKAEADVADRYLDLVNRHGEDPAIFPALEFLVVQETAHAARALEIVTQHHVRSREVGEFCLRLLGPGGHWPATTEKLLRTVSTENPHHDAQALATLALARLLKTRSEAEATPACERDDLRSEMEKLLTALMEKHARVPLPKDGPKSRFAGDQARSLLYELRFLSVGQPVPNLEGTDLEGKPLRLKDYRGKVILLDFFAFG